MGISSLEAKATKKEGERRGKRRRKRRDRREKRGERVREKEERKRGADVEQEVKWSNEAEEKKGSEEEVGEEKEEVKEGGGREFVDSTYIPKISSSDIQSSKSCLFVKMRIGTLASRAFMRLSKYWKASTM